QQYPPTRTPDTTEADNTLAAPNSNDTKHEPHPADRPAPDRRYGQAASTRLRTRYAGQMKLIVPPSGSVTVAGRPAACDTLGRVRAVTDPLGRVTRFGWTLEGRRSWRVLPDGTSERWSRRREQHRGLHRRGRRPHPLRDRRVRPADHAHRAGRQLAGLRL